jgi:hypothetical protein
VGSQFLVPDPILIAKSHGSGGKFMDLNSNLAKLQEKRTFLMVCKKSGITPNFMF